MSVSRQQVHALVDIVKSAELDVVYHILTKFIEEDEATPDEIEAIAAGRKEFREGKFFRDEDIDWDNLDKLDLD